MKCLVFSDSHRNTHNMNKALRLHPDAEVVFFLGDGISDAYMVSSTDRGRAWMVVAGNCDPGQLFADEFRKKTDAITLEENRIVFTHGDLYGAKHGVGGLLSLAKERNANIVLFGHTHDPFEKYYSDDEVYLFNPGSIAIGSYGIMTLRSNGVLFSHGKV